MAEENETKCEWTLGFYREGGGERGGPMGRAKARGCVCEPGIVCACPPSLLTASFHSIRSVSVVWGAPCVGRGHSQSEKILIMPLLEHIHTGTDCNGTDIWLSLQFSLSPHNKVQLCTSSELIWSSSPSWSQFFCRSKRDFNDVTEHWVDYVNLHYK